LARKPVLFSAAEPASRRRRPNRGRAVCLPPSAAPQPTPQTRAPTPSRTRVLSVAIVQGFEPRARQLQALCPALLRTGRAASTTPATAAAAQPRPGSQAQLLGDRARRANPSVALCLLRNGQRRRCLQAVTHIKSVRPEPALVNGRFSCKMIQMSWHAPRQRLELRRQLQKLPNRPRRVRCGPGWTCPGRHHASSPIYSTITTLPPNPQMESQTDTSRKSRARVCVFVSGSGFVHLCVRAHFVCAPFSRAFPGPRRQFQCSSRLRCRPKEHPMHHHHVR
jgi:hypothetical protein